MSDSWVRDKVLSGDIPRPGETADVYVAAFVRYRLQAVNSPGGLFEAQRARLAGEQADKVARENAEARGELAPVAEIGMAVQTVIDASRNRLMKLPAAIARGDMKLRERAERAVEEALDELSVARVNEISGGEAEEDDDFPDD